MNRGDVRTRGGVVQHALGEIPGATYGLKAKQNDGVSHRTEYQGRVHFIHVNHFTLMEGDRHDMVLEAEMHPVRHIMVDAMNKLKFTN